MTRTEDVSRTGPRSGAAVGVVLICIGALYLAAQWFGFDLGHLGWPFLIIVPGVALVGAAALADRSFANLAVPGSMATTTGLLLLVQNTFNLWDTWAYAWSLLIVGSGLGMVLQGERTDQPRLRASGWRTVQGGVVTFLLFGAFFEVVLNLSHFADTGLSRFGLPALLIGVGAMCLIRPWSQPAPR
jgi:hypothetical protein